MSRSNNFVEYFDRLFKSERSWQAKILGAGVIGFATAGFILYKNSGVFSFSAQLLTLVAVPMAVMLGACVLLRADFVRRQLRTGNRVGLFSRIMFGAGIWSFLVWIILALLVGFPLAIWLGSMTSGRPLQ